MDFLRRRTAAAAASEINDTRNQIFLGGGRIFRRWINFRIPFCSGQQSPVIQVTRRYRYVKKKRKKRRKKEIKTLYYFFLSFFFFVVVAFVCTNANVEQKSKIEKPTRRFVFWWKIDTHSEVVYSTGDQSRHFS